MISLGREFLLKTAILAILANSRRKKTCPIFIGKTKLFYTVLKFKHVWNRLKDSCISRRDLFESDIVSSILIDSKMYIAQFWLIQLDDATSRHVSFFSPLPLLLAGSIVKTIMLVYNGTIGSGLTKCGLVGGILSLDAQELNNQTGSAVDYLGRHLVQWAVLDRHDLQLVA